MTRYTKAVASASETEIVSKSLKTSIHNHTGFGNIDDPSLSLPIDSECAAGYSWEVISLAGKLKYQHEHDNSTPNLSDEFYLQYAKRMLDIKYDSKFDSVIPGIDVAPDPKYAQYSYEEIIAMANNGVNIPKKVLAWAKAQQEADITDYIVISDNIDIEEYSQNSHNDESELNQIRAEVKDYAIKSKKAQEDIETNTVETNVLTDKASDIVKEQKDVFSSNSISNAEQMANEWKALDDKKKTQGKLSDFEESRYKSLSKKLQKNSEVIKYLEKNASQLDDFLVSIDGLSDRAYEGLLTAQNAISAASNLANTNSLLNEEAKVHSYKMAATHSSALGDILSNIDDVQLSVVTEKIAYDLENLGIDTNKNIQSDDTQEVVSFANDYIDRALYIENIVGDINDSQDQYEDDSINNNDEPIDKTEEPEVEQSPEPMVKNRSVEFDNFEDETSSEPEEMLNATSDEIPETSDEQESPAKSPKAPNPDDEITNPGDKDISVPDNEVTILDENDITDDDTQVLELQPEDESADTTEEPEIEQSPEPMAKNRSVEFDNLEDEIVIKPEEMLNATTDEIFETSDEQESPVKASKTPAKAPKVPNPGAEMINPKDEGIADSDNGSIISDENGKIDDESSKDVKQLPLSVGIGVQPQYTDLSLNYSDQVDTGKTVFSKKVRNNSSNKVQNTDQSQNDKKQEKIEDSQAEFKSAYGTNLDFVKLVVANNITNLISLGPQMYILALIKWAAIVGLSVLDLYAKKSVVDQSSKAADSDVNNANMSTKQLAALSKDIITQHNKNASEIKTYGESYKELNDDTVNQQYAMMQEQQTLLQEGKITEDQVKTDFDDPNLAAKAAISAKADGISAKDAKLLATINDPAAKTQKVMTQSKKSAIGFSNLNSKLSDRNDNNDNVGDVIIKETALEAGIITAAMATLLACGPWCWSLVAAWAVALAENAGVAATGVAAKFVSSKVSDNIEENNQNYSEMIKNLDDDDKQVSDVRKSIAKTSLDSMTFLPSNEENVNTSKSKTTDEADEEGNFSEIIRQEVINPNSMDISDEDDIKNDFEDTSENSDIDSDKPEDLKLAKDKIIAFANRTRAHYENLLAAAATNTDAATKSDTQDKYEIKLTRFNSSGSIRSKKRPKKVNEISPIFDRRKRK